MIPDPQKKDSGPAGYDNRSLLAEAPATQKRWGEVLRTVNPFLFGNAILQIITGICVVFLSILRLIEPAWMASLMSMLGSVLTMLGAYLLYDTVKERYSVAKLIRDAVHRLVNHQN